MVQRFQEKLRISLNYFISEEIDFSHESLHKFDDQMIAVKPDLVQVVTMEQQRDRH